mgnify:CR=1 FL=1
MSNDFQSKVKSVKKLTNNVGGGSENKNAAVTATADKLFLLSYSEIVPNFLLGIRLPGTRRSRPRTGTRLSLDSFRLPVDFLRGCPVRGFQRQGDE